MRRKNTLLVAAGIGAGLAASRAWRKRAGIELYGKVALIAGCARGLSLAVARALGAEGCRIAISGRDAADLEQARLDLSSRGIDAFSLRCDTTDCAQAEGMVGAVLDRFGAIDILVNCACPVSGERPEDVSLEDFERAMDEMFWGAVYPIRAVLPHMLERRQGRIINVGATGRQSTTHRVAWECAELAAAGLTGGLRRELAPDGIAVISVTPGPGMSPDRAARRVVSAARSGADDPVIVRAAGGIAERLLGGPPDWIWAVSVLGRAARRYLAT